MLNAIDHARYEAQRAINNERHLAIGSVFEKYEIEDENSVIATEILHALFDCEYCGGSGEQVDRAHQQGGDVVDDRFYKCTMCNGTGKK